MTEDRPKVIWRGDFLDGTLTLYEHPEPRLREDKVVFIFNSIDSGLNGEVEIVDKSLPSDKIVDHILQTISNIYLNSLQSWKNDAISKGGYIQ